MAQAALRHIIMGLATSGLLMGCVQGAGPGDGTEGTAATAAPGAARVRAGAPRDIEAPEVFQVTDSALWDGRPSLGGIWVASSDVNDPERVVMFNPATGKSVQGALFRRERDNPGPPLQISSDAAEALGILAGQPVEISVTALRREEPQAEPEAPSDTADAPADPTEEGDEPTTDSDADASATAAAATAALAATGVAASGAEAAADTAVEAAETGLEAGAEAAVVEPPKRKTWKERRAEAKAAREAKKAAADAAKAAEAAPDGTEVPATSEAASVAAIETQPLDASAPEAAAAEPEAEAMAEPPKTRRQIRDAEAAAAAEAQAATAAQAEAAASEASAPAVASRLIQVASFSKEANATRAVEALAKIGISAQTRKSEIEGKAVWGVVATGDDTLLKSIKDAGFADAFFLQ